MFRYEKNMDLSCVASQAKQERVWKNMRDYYLPKANQQLETCGKLVVLSFEQLC